MSSNSSMSSSDSDMSADDYVLSGSEFHISDDEQETPKQMTIFETISLCDETDITFEIIDPGAAETRQIHLASASLSAASPVFKAMFTGPFYEGVAIRDGRHPKITLEENLQAMEYVLRAMHHRAEDPAQHHEQLTPEDMQHVAEIAIIADKYDCAAALPLADGAWWNRIAPRFVRGGPDYAVWTLVAARYLKVPQEGKDEIVKKLALYTTVGSLERMKKHEYALLHLPRRVFREMREQMARAYGLMEDEINTLIFDRLLNGIAVQDCYVCVDPGCHGAAPAPEADERPQPGGCPACGREFLVLGTCTFNHRVGVMAGALNREGIFPMVKVNSTNPLALHHSGSVFTKWRRLLAIEADFMRDHVCEINYGCAMLGPVSLTIERIGMALREFGLEVPEAWVLRAAWDTAM